MDKYPDVRKPLYSSITEDEKDIIFLQLTEFAHILRKPRQRLTLSDDIVKLILIRVYKEK
jgi:hypothetical protein